MKKSNYILLLLLGMLAAPALAQESNVPGNVKPNGMSDQDYQIQRDNILKRMKATSPQQSKLTPEQEGNVKGEPSDNSAYGQGYGSRKDSKDAAESKPETERSRPERPHIERPERPHIERPGRP